MSFVFRAMKNANIIVRRFRVEIPICAKLRHTQTMQIPGFTQYIARTLQFLPAVIGLTLYMKSKTDLSITYAAAEGAENVETNPVPTLEDDSEVVMLLKRAKLAELKQEFSEADELYHHALRLVLLNQREKRWTDDRIIQTKVYIYDCMANLALVRGKLTEAEKLFKETIQGLLQRGTKQDDNSIVELSLKLAVIYAAQNRNSEAETGYDFCINTQQKKVKSSSHQDDDTVALLGMSYDAYSRYLVTRKEFRAALDNLQKALEIAISVLGETHQQVAVLLSDIATVATLNNDYDAARDKLVQAISIAEKIDSLHLPTMYCNLGAIHVHKQNFTQARVCYRKALKLAQQKKDKEAQERAEEGLKSANTKK